MTLTEAIKVAEQIGTRPASERREALATIDAWLAGKERSATLMVWFRRAEASALRASLANPAAQAA